MKLRNALIAGATVMALATAPIFAATLSGKVIDVNENSITVMKDGQSTVYILPPDLEIKSRSDREISPSQLRGQTVTLTVSDGMQRQPGQPEARPEVTNIRVDGDLEIDSDTDLE